MKVNNTTTDDDNDVETSLSDDFGTTWTRKRTKRLKKRWKRERRLERPSTAVLKRPRILDESLRDKVDMTMTKKHFLAAFKLCTDLALKRCNATPPRSNRAAVGYRRETRMNYSRTRLMKSKARENSPSSKIPQYKPPQRELPKMPNVDQKRPKSRKKLDRQITHVLEPCQSCGRSDLPERFHTHPPSEAENNGKSEASSKIPIRLAHPPKRMTSLDQESAMKSPDKKKTPSTSTSPVKKSNPEARKNSPIKHNKPSQDAKLEASKTLAITTRKKLKSLNNDGNSTDKVLFSLLSDSLYRS